MNKGLSYIFLLMLSLLSIQESWCVAPSHNTNNIFQKVYGQIKEDVSTIRDCAVSWNSYSLDEKKACKKALARLSGELLVFAGVVVIGSIGMQRLWAHRERKRKAEALVEQDKIEPDTEPDTETGFGSLRKPYKQQTEETHLFIDDQEREKALQEQAILKQQEEAEQKRILQEQCQQEEDNRRRLEEEQRLKKAEDERNRLERAQRDFESESDLKIYKIKPFTNEYLTKKDNDGKNAFFIAAEKGNTTLVKEFLGWGADVYVTDNKGQSLADIRLSPEIEALIRPYREQSQQKGLNETQRKVEKKWQEKKNITFSGLEPLIDLGRKYKAKVTTENLNKFLLKLKEEIWQEWINKNLEEWLQKKEPQLIDQRHRKKEVERIAAKEMKNFSFKDIYEQRYKFEEIVKRETGLPLREFLQLGKVSWDMYLKARKNFDKDFSIINFTETDIKNEFEIKDGIIDYLYSDVFKDFKPTFTKMFTQWLESLG